jgi:hypothetical protein
LLLSAKTPASEEAGYSTKDEFLRMSTGPDSFEWLSDAASTSNRQKIRGTKNFRAADLDELC